MSRKPQASAPLAVMGTFPTLLSNPIQTPNLACAPPLFLKTQAAPNVPPFESLNLYLQHQDPFIRGPSCLHHVHTSRAVTRNFSSFNLTPHPAPNTFTLSIWAGHFLISFYETLPELPAHTPHTLPSPNRLWHLPSLFIKNNFAEPNEHE